MIDLSRFHIPHRANERAHGRKLKELGKYSRIGTIIATIIGLYFQFVRSGHITDLNWNIALGICLTIVLGQILKLRKLNIFVTLLVWILLIVSFVVVIERGISGSELAIILYSFAGILLIISIYLSIRGDYILKTFKQEYPFKNI